MENGTHDVKGSQAEAGASSALLYNGSSNVLNPPSTPPLRSAGECALSQSNGLYIHELQELDSVATPKSQRTVDVSLTSPNLQPRQISIPDFLTRPLLNLKPLSDRDSEHEGTPSSSPKKKRRRRRKKKNMVVCGAADSQIDETSTMSSSVTCK